MAKKKVKVLEQPTVEDELLLSSVVEDEADVVLLRGRRVKVRWMKPGTRRAITRVMLASGDEETVNCKCAALILLNGFWKIKLLWWLLWRWMWYVREYTDEELLPVIETGKKKLRVEGYCVCTMFLTEMKDTAMTMTRAEVERIRQESSGVKRGTVGRSTVS